MDSKIIILIIFIIAIVMIIINLIIYKIAQYFLHESMFKPKKLEKNESMELEALTNELKTKFNDQITIEELFLETPDKQFIHCIHYKNPTKKGTILHAHGNYGNLKRTYNIFKLYGNLGNIFILDYRGYGKSSGTITPDGALIDIKTAWNYLIKKQNIQPYRITVYGISLGAGISSELTNYLVNDKKTKPYALILESGFSSIREMSKKQLCCGLQNVLIPNYFNNYENVKALKDKLPILVAHSPEDELIAFSHSQKILENQKTNPQLKFFKLSGLHSSTNYTGEYVNTIRKYIFE
jgi:fermentation-respiration switch protein FrsA (DUF1100 family)